MIKGERWICVVGEERASEFCCAIVVVYGAHSRKDRPDMWKELEDIRSLVHVPLIFMGDFNEVLKLDERKKEVMGVLTALTNLNSGYYECNYLTFHFVEGNILGPEGTQ